LKRSLLRTRSGARGFTLAEVAVAIVIVGMGLIWILEGLNGAKLTAAHTRNYKLARELGLLTLGRIASGELREDLERGLLGTYAEEGYPEFSYEVIVGDETFRERNDDGSFDNWNRPDRQDEDEEEDGDPSEEEDKAFEKVKVKIGFPKIREFTSELILERWIPWTQVYGPKEEDPAAAEAADGNDPANNSGGNNNSGGGSSGRGGSNPLTGEPR